MPSGSQLNIYSVGTICRMLGTAVGTGKWLRVKQTHHPVREDIDQ